MKTNKQCIWQSWQFEIFSVFLLLLLFFAEKLFLKSWTSTEKGDRVKEGQEIVRELCKLSFAFHVPLFLFLSLSIYLWVSQSVNKYPVYGQAYMQCEYAWVIEVLFVCPSLAPRPLSLPPSWSLSIFRSSCFSRLCVFFFKCIYMFIEQRQKRHTHTRLSTTTFILSLAFSLSLTFFLFTIFGHPFCHTHARSHTRIHSYTNKTKHWQIHTPTTNINIKV